MTVNETTIPADAALLAANIAYIDGVNLILPEQS